MIRYRVFMAYSMQDILNTGLTIEELRDVLSGYVEQGFGAMPVFMSVDEEGNAKNLLCEVEGPHVFNHEHRRSFDTAWNEEGTEPLTTIDPDDADFQVIGICLCP